MNVRGKGWKEKEPHEGLPSNLRMRPWGIGEDGRKGKDNMNRGVHFEGKSKNLWSLTPLGNGPRALELSDWQSDYPMENKDKSSWHQGNKNSATTSLCSADSEASKWKSLALTGKKGTRSHMRWWNWRYVTIVSSRETINIPEKINMKAFIMH